MDYYIIKRDGRRTKFDSEKIKSAVLKAFIAVDGSSSAYAEEKAQNIADYIQGYMEGIPNELTIDEIQALVEHGLMATKRKDVATAYIEYRHDRDYNRENTIDKTIDEIVENESEYWNGENSNKDPYLATTQRDYMAGAVSTDASLRRLLPKDIVEAHLNGLIHFHDMDYFLQPIHNCDLINLEDMLQNGTVISKTTIEKPHRFLTACNIATQIIAQVASSQYGGQSISLAHLSSFVDISRQNIKKEVQNEFQKLIELHEISKMPSDNLLNKIIEKRLRKEIRDGVQTIQYQILTLMTTNGQTPFITIYMNLAEVPEGKEREDLALCIEEVLKQRIEGVKNEKGIFITPTFPKLIYALDDFNTYEKSKYYYLTELAAKCTAKRLVPDYISNKVQRELKQGQTYTCMGCRSFLTPDRTSQNWARALNYKKGQQKFYGRLTA